MKLRIYSALLIGVITGLVSFAHVPNGLTVQVQDRIHTVTEEWRGVWEVTIAYRDHETGALVATDVTTAEICPGEPVIPQQLNVYVRCSEETAANEIGVSCHNRQRMIRDTGCDVFGAAELASQRSGDSWSGTGSWSVSSVGQCNQSSHAEDFVVTGIRISTAAACDSEGSSLLERFFVHSRLIPFLEGSN